MSTMWRGCLLLCLASLIGCGETAQAPVDGGAVATDGSPDSGGAAGADGGAPAPDGPPTDGGAPAPDGLPTDGGAPSCGLDLPLRATPPAPVLTAIRLECQEGRYLNLMATVTDPQGDADLRDVPQVFQVFDGPDCARARWTVTDDVAGSGLDESFGVVFERDTAPTVFDAICASERWPVRAQLRDASGSRTEGLVSAVVSR